MTNQSTIDKLIEMRLSSMADAFRIQMNDSAMKEVPFEDRFGMLVDVEYTNRKNNRLKRLIRQAELEHVFCQVLFLKKSVGIPFFQHGIFPAFSGHYASLRMRACSIR